MVFSLPTTDKHLERKLTYESKPVVEKEAAETLNQTKSVAFTVLYPSTTLKYMSAAIIEIKSPLFFLQDSYVFVAILVFIICSQFCRHYNTFCLWRIFSCYNFMIETNKQNLCSLRLLPVCCEKSMAGSVGWWWNFNSVAGSESFFGVLATVGNSWPRRHGQARAGFVLTKLNN